MQLLALEVEHKDIREVVGNPGIFIRQALDELKPAEEDHDEFIATVEKYCVQLGIEPPYRFYKIQNYNGTLSQEMLDFCHKCSQWGISQKRWRENTHAIGTNLKDWRLLTNVKRNAPVETINEIIASSLESQANILRVYYDDMPTEATHTYARIIRGQIPRTDWLKYLGLHWSLDAYIGALLRG